MKKKWDSEKHWTQCDDLRIISLTLYALILNWMPVTHFNRWSCGKYYDTFHFYRCPWTYDRYPTVSRHRHKKTCTAQSNPIFCLFSRLTRLFVSVSSIFSLLLLCSPLLTVQESPLSSWPEGATGCWCQFQGHQMGTVIIIAPPLSCQCARQQNKRDPLEAPIKSFGLWSWSKKEKPKHCAKSTRNVLKRAPENGNDSHPEDIPGSSVLMSGAQVFGPFDPISVSRGLREWVMQWCCC